MKALQNFFFFFYILLMDYASKVTSMSRLGLEDFGRDSIVHSFYINGNLLKVWLFASVTVFHGYDVVVTPVSLALKISLSLVFEFFSID